MPEFKSLTLAQSKIEKEKRILEKLNSRISDQTGNNTIKRVQLFRFILEMFDTISSGIDALFERMDKERESVSKRLGNSSKVDNENILDFLLKNENQLNVLIRVFLTSQQDTIEVRLTVTLRSGSLGPMTPKSPCLTY